MKLVEIVVILTLIIYIYLQWKESIFSFINKTKDIPTPPKEEEKKPDDEKEEEEEENIVLYKWNILENNIPLKYIDIITDDRIEGVRTNGNPGVFSLKSKRWTTHIKFYAESTSATGYYDSNLKTIWLYVSLKDTKIGRYVNNKWDLPDLGMSAHMVSCGFGGGLYCIGPDTKIWLYGGPKNWLNKMEGERNFSFINASKVGFICGVKKDGRIYKSHWDKLIEIPNNGIKFKQASLGTDDSIFGLDINNNLYKLENEWIKVNKKAKMITHHQEDAIYVINMDDKLEHGAKI